MHAKAGMQMCMSRKGTSGYGASLYAVEKIRGSRVVCYELHKSHDEYTA